MSAHSVNYSKVSQNRMQIGKRSYDARPLVRRTAVSVTASQWEAALRRRTTDSPRLRRDILTRQWEGRMRRKRAF